MSPYHNQSDPLANIPVTPLMVDHLRATRPWVLLISIVMFIAAGFMVLGGLAMMFMPTSPAMGGFGFGPLLGLIYFVMSALYIAPAYLLLKYASHIKDLVNGGGDVAMENALGSQKSFWRYSGIVTLIVIGLYVLFFVFAILGAMSMTMMR
jgi:hypothetical protein